MTAVMEPRTDATPRAIVNAAAYEFARSGYNHVNLGDVVTRAGVTKGALHFHFPTKQDLALAVINEQRAISRRAVDTVFEQRLTALECLIDIAYGSAQLITEDAVVRAGIRLTAEIGRSTGTLRDNYEDWSGTVADLIRCAIIEGDVSTNQRSEDIAALLVSLFFGLQDYASPSRDECLQRVEKAWLLVLPGLVPTTKLSYFTQFILRRSDARSS